MRVEIEGALFQKERTAIEERVLRAFASYGNDVPRVAVRVTRALGASSARDVDVLVVTRGFRCLTEHGRGATLTGALNRATDRLTGALATTLGVSPSRRHSGPRRAAARYSLVVPKQDHALTG